MLILRVTTQHVFTYRGSPHYHCLLWLDCAPIFDSEDPSTFGKCVSFADELISCDPINSPEYFSFQVHHHTHTCFRSDSDKATGKCRFDLPMFPVNNTKILTPLNEANCNSYKRDCQIGVLIKQFLTENTNADENDILERFGLNSLFLRKSH